MLLIVVCVVTFAVSSEAAAKMENHFGFDYANPVYVSNVLAAIISGGVGSLGLLLLHKFAKQELEKKGKENVGC